MIIPTGTDAPLYHPLWGTLGLLLANVAVFFFIDISENSWWILHHGTINPVQWLTSVFAHADFFHLLGNMLFLVIFAGIVEGKVGWLWLLIIYGTIAITSNAVEQVLMLGSDRGSLGASGVIYGLLVMCLFWAPCNHVRGLFILIVYPFQINWPIWLVALLFIGLDFLNWLLLGFAMSTPMLHILGAAAGVWPGWYFLTRDRVDCEGWDGITIYKRWRAGLAINATALNQAYRDDPDADAASDPLDPEPETELPPRPPERPGTASVHKNWMDHIGQD